MNKFIALLILCFFFLVGCINKSKQCSSCGTVIARNYYYDTSNNKYKTSEFYSPSTKMWFKDSAAIVKTMGFVIDTDTNGYTSTEMKLAYYTYIDLTNKGFYQYNSFTDTATIIKKFTITDSNSLQVESVMWGFYDLPIKKSEENLKILSDTAVEGVKYKRKSFVNSFQGRNDSVFKNTVVAYYRCDKTGTLFRYGDNFSEEEPCPMVRIEFLPLPPLSLQSLLEVEFISDKLTPEELKVFNAWEQNAKKYPVKQ